MIDKSYKNFDKYNFPKNLIFLGEVPYSKLIDYLKYIDICIIPFVINELTNATNPVKLYEYFAAGKPVVSTNLPELNDYKNYAYVSRNHKEFIENLNKAALDLNDKPINNKLIMQRKKIAKKSSWINRGRDYIKVLNLIRSESIFKTTRKINKPEKSLTSILILSYNNVNLLKKCINSVIKYTDKGTYEIIVIDNASNSETVNYLKSLEKDPSLKYVIKIIFNSSNKGFSAAFNQGLEIFNGDYVVMLNNDLKVSRNWLKQLLFHYVNNENIGLIGPVTNNIGNEAMVETFYISDYGYLQQSKLRALEKKDLFFETSNIAFFCVLLSRDVFKKVGFLDSSFGLGFFEDDDYCKRVKSLGYKIICAEDVLIHHELSASFSKLNIKKRNKLFRENKKIFEKKWGKWQPHTDRSF